MRIPVSKASRLVAAISTLLLFTSAAPADVTDVSPTPSTRTLPLGIDASGSVPVSLRWDVTTIYSFPPAPSVVTSTAGRFRLGTRGPVIATVSTQVMASVPPFPFGVPETVSVLENLVVPASVISAALEHNAPRILYERTFGDDRSITTATGTVSLHLLSSKSGEVEALRVDLHFEGGAALRVVQRGATLRPVADIAYQGAGRVEWVWEVTTGGSSAGEPIFRPLHRERRRLDAAGRTRIRGPMLPTAMTGLRLVRLRFVDPRARFTVEPIRYLVRDSGDDESETADIELLAPEPGAVLEAETLFSWKEVPGASVYVLQLLERGSNVQAGSNLASGDVEPIESKPRTVLATDPDWEGALVVGLMIDGETTRASLEPSQWRHLLPGHGYRWRVTALSAEGELLSRSDSRPLRTGDAPTPDTAPSD